MHEDGEVSRIRTSDSSTYAEELIAFFFDDDVLNIAFAFTRILLHSAIFGPYLDRTNQISYLAINGGETIMRKHVVPCFKTTGVVLEVHCKTTGIGALHGNVAVQGDVDSVKRKAPSALSRGSLGSCTTP